MSRAVASAVAGALTLVSLSACGSVQQNGSGAGPSSSAATSASPPSSVTPPTMNRTKPMPATPTGPPGEFNRPPTNAGRQSTVRVRGTLSDGVESNCTLLTSKGVVYLLLWGDKTPPTGTEIEVEGTIKSDLMTTCQQGTPLVVHRILSP